MPAPFVVAMADILEEIYQRFPASRDFDPCPCGLTLAILKEEWIKPWHFPVRDDELRDRVAARIRDRRLGFTNVPDGVLVICEIA